MEGGNLRNALQELQQIIITPIKAYSPPSLVQTAPDTATSLDTATPTSDATKTGADKEPASEGFQSHNPPPCDGDSPATPISDGDIAGQFTRVMGKGENENDVYVNCRWLVFFLQKNIDTSTTIASSAFQMSLDIHLLTVAFFLFVSVHPAAGVKAR